MAINQTTILAIQTITSEIYRDLVKVRRDLHRHPELSGQEDWTSQYLADHLISLGLSVRTGVGGYGLCADLVTDPGKPTVALRVDMDALPIQELNQVSYTSTIPGLMHACGHDIHAAIGIGSAWVLTQMRGVLPGNVRFIFQPEEEEITGALKMIRAGVLQNPIPAAIFGLHVAPLLASQIGWTDDLFLAGFEHFLVTLAPQIKRLPIPGKMDALAQRCCRRIINLNRWHLPETWDDMHHFWEIMQAGPDDLKRFMVFDATTNDDVQHPYQGQFGLGIKAANRHLRIAALARVRKTLNTICRAANARYHIEPMGSMVDMRNDPGLVQTSLPALEKSIGADNLIHLNAPFPFNCEDFAFYTKDIPGAMYWLGAADPSAGKYAMLHTHDFDVDETCIETGTIAMASILVNALSQITPG